MTRSNVQRIHRSADRKDKDHTDVYCTAQHLVNGNILIETYGMQFIYDGNYFKKISISDTRPLWWLHRIFPIDKIYVFSPFKSGDPMEEGQESQKNNLDFEHYK
ncbi:hypothetical protein [Anditalea andensis]|nr:hypothetical protein [Anditalea andensis]